jgi:hypothetical protein
MSHCKTTKTKIATDFGCDFLQLFHFGNTLFANMLVAVLHKLVIGTTENASRFQFLQDDLIIVQADLQFVPFCNVQCTPQLNRQYDPAKLIHLANYTRRSHIVANSFLLTGSLSLYV